LFCDDDAHDGDDDDDDDATAKLVPDGKKQSAIHDNDSGKEWRG